jgi:hypothetical protein
VTHITALSSNAGRTSSRGLPNSSSTNAMSYAFTHDYNDVKSSGTPTPGGGLQLPTI